MILNRLIVPEGNPVIFYLNHSENGQEYANTRDEYYYINISEENDPSIVCLHWETNQKYFDFDPSLPEGRYVFEIGLRKPDGSSVVILPALDERRHPLNELLILRRLGE